MVRETFSKDKLLDFLEKWWHKNIVLEKPEEKFIENFKNWAKEKRYHPNAEKAKSIYKLVEESILTQPSSSSYIKTSIQEGVGLIKNLSIQNNTNMTKQTTAIYAQKTKYYCTQQPIEKATEYIKVRKVYVKTVHLSVDVQKENQGKSNNQTYLARLHRLL